MWLRVYWLLKLLLGLLGYASPVLSRNSRVLQRFWNSPVPDDSDGYFLLCLPRSSLVVSGVLVSATSHDFITWIVSTIAATLNLFGLETLADTVR